MTENRNRRRKKRPAYDQAKDAQRRRGVNGVRSQNSSHPITNPNFDPDAPRPSRYTERSVDYGSSYSDNSIQFPTGGRPAQNQNRNQNRDPNRRPQNGRNQNGRAGQRPRSSRNAARTGQSRPQSRNPQPGRNPQRLRPTEANLRDPARREGKKKRKLTRKVLRRRRIIRRLTALAMLLCVIAAGIYLTVTMLFKVSAIQVRTADGVVSEAGGYSSEQIVQALGVNLEENIFSFDPASKAAALEQVFPMLENIRVERDYPGTVVIQVTEAQPAYTMQTSGGWLTLSASLKILSSDAAQPAGLPTLYGGEPVSQTPGTQLSFEQPAPASSVASDSAASDSASDTAEEAGDKRLDSLNTLLAALDALGMRGDVTRIEFADPEEMSFLYQDRISVLLGTLNELDYKLKLAQHVLLNADGSGCAATDTGTLDFTHISMSSTRKFTFAQGEPKLPSGYVIPEPAAEDTAADDAAPAEKAAASEGDAAAEPPADGAAEQAVPEAETSAEADPAPAAQEPAGTGAAN